MISFYSGLRKSAGAKIYKELIVSRFFPVVKQGIVKAGAFFQERAALADGV